MQSDGERYAYNKYALYEYIFKQGNENDPIHKKPFTESIMKEVETMYTNKDDEEWKFIQ